MRRKSNGGLFWVAVGFLVLAGVFVLGNVRIALSGPPVVESSTEWYTVGNTSVSSVFVDDLDGDGVKEIVTGGRADDGSRENGQLRVWNWDGSTMTLEASTELYTVGNTAVQSVFVDDVDGDGVKEIITGGYANASTWYSGQLRVWRWDGSTLILENSTEWYTVENTRVASVFVDDVDRDGVREIITGGSADMEVGGWESALYGQLRVWNWDGSTMTLEVSQEWRTVVDTQVRSVFVDDVDGDGLREILTGGWDNDGTRANGQLRVWSWDGSKLTLESSTIWYTVGYTSVGSVFVDDVDGDNVKEIMTGGFAYNGTGENGQLRVWSWDGSTMTLEDSTEWYTVSFTYVYSVSVEDVDGDGVKEIITGGSAPDGTRYNGQLRVWNYMGTRLVLEISREWYTVSGTSIISVFAADLDGGFAEIITAGTASDGTRINGQLRIWSTSLVGSLSVKVDTGSTYFRGEIAEFYASTSYRGTPANATQIASTLYRPDGTQTSLTAQNVATGLYKIQYTIPADAPTGTYALRVEASYHTNAKDLKGEDIASFMLSPTLTQWNAWLVAIETDTATIKTDVGVIKLNLTEINARITSIDGNIATIETDVGTIQADISTLDTESIPSLADTQTGQGAILNLTTILSAVAAVGTLITLTVILRKRKQI